MIRTRYSNNGCLHIENARCLGGPNLELKAWKVPRELLSEDRRS